MLRRLGLIGLLLLLGIAGGLPFAGGIFPAEAGAAKCLDCEGEEPGEEAEAQILTIQIQGPGSVSSTTKTVCENTGASNTCELEVAEGKKVTLSAAPAPGFTFIGWSGSCSGTGTCEVTMTEPKTVTATFQDKTPPAPPTITSPTEGQVFERTAEEPVSVSFGGEGSSYLCSVDFLPSIGCSPPSWSTGKLGAGEHTVQVWAKDAVGNISTAATRHFKVVINEPPSEDGGSGGTGTGTGGQPGTGASAAPAQAPPPLEIAAKLLARSSLRGEETIFRKLALKALPAGARVVATCKGRDCPFRRRQPKVRGGVADLTAVLAGRELGAGVQIELKVTAPGMLGQTITVKTRAGRAPKVTKR